jgi:hypothetical protein
VDASTGKTGRAGETREKALGNYVKGSRGLQATGGRPESRGQTGTDTGWKGSSQEKGYGTSEEWKGRLDWMLGLKEREDIAGLTGSRAKAMDRAIYPKIASSVLFVS